MNALDKKDITTDSRHSIFIFRDVNWLIDVKENGKPAISFRSSRPDSLLGRMRFDTAILTADITALPFAPGSSVALHYVLEGSISISLNGRDILVTGAFDTQAGGQHGEYIRDDYVWFSLADSVQHIQIIYLPQPATGIFDLSLRIVDQIAARQDQQDSADERDQSRGIAFYYLAFCIVFISLFISTRDRVEYLSFALFCLFGALSFIFNTVDIGLLYNLDSFAGIFSFEFLAIFLCKILMGRTRSKWPLIVITGFLVLSAFPAVRFFYINTSSGPVPLALTAIFVSLYAYTVSTILYYLLKGIRKKQWEARTVVLVCLVPIAVFLLLLIGGVVYTMVKVVRHQSYYKGLLPMLSTYLSYAIVYVYPLSVVYIVGRRNRLAQKQLQEQVISIAQLSEENLRQEKDKQHILEHQKEVLEQEVASRTAEIRTQKEEIETQHDELKVEKKKSDDLLRNILPDEVAAELKAKGYSDAKLFENVSVLFTDFVNFTIAGEQMTPQQLINELHACFKAFDEITVKYNLEKIKTIGDAYLAVCGLPVADPRHAENVVRAARDINAFMQQRLSMPGSNSFQIRMGIHSGPVVAGIVGVKKFAYDVWGDTVNTAARLEQKGEPGKINISQSTYELVKDAFDCEYRGEIAAKNKGPMKMYFVR